MTVKSTVVLDTHAIMKFFLKEEGYQKIKDYLIEAKNGTRVIFMSLINWGEVFYSICRKKGESAAHDTLVLMTQMPIQVIEADKDLVFQAALFKARYPIAYADCFAAALAKREGCPVVTGDKEFKSLESEIKIIWL